MQLPDDPAAQVTWVYRTMLGREPDPGGLAVYTQALRDGRGLAWLLEQTVLSEEFRAKSSGWADFEAQAFRLNQASPMHVDVDCTPAELASLWDHVSAVWSRLGQEDPLWSVLTHDRYRAEVIGPADVAEFYGSGHAEVDALNTWLRRAGLSVRPDAICAEYGCGVGRITHALARQYGRVRAFDVSAPHQRIAEAHMASEGIGNVEFVQVRGAADLQALDGIDVFFSVIVLQHSPPPIILDVLRHAFRGLRPGGYAYFQVPTYARGYQYSLSNYLAQFRSGTGDGAMEMHFVPQQVILGLAHEAGLVAIEVQPDAYIGNSRNERSNTFLFARR